MRTKKILYLALATALMVINTGSSVASGFVNIFSLNNNSGLNVEMITPQLYDVNLKMYDRSGKTVFSESVQSGSVFNKSFDFSSLDDGRYTLIAEKQNLRFNQIIRIKNQEFKVLRSFFTSVPLIRFSEETLYVHYVNDGGNDVTIEISDGFGYVYQTEFQSDVVFNKAFDMSVLGEGSYTLTLSAGGDRHFQEFTID